MKNILKNRFFRLLALGLILILALSQSDILANLIERHSTAQAVGDLTIDWGVPSGPIFVVSNMLPGEEETRTITITNNASVVRPVGVRGIKTDETGNLSTVLEIVIQADGTDLYGGTSPAGPKTLDQFFSESAGPDAISLFDLNPGSSKIVTSRVYFKPEAGNEFQAKTVVFDLQIGIAIAIPDECSHIIFSGPPIFGTAGNDNLRGTKGNDLIFGLEGNDKINGGNGNDCLVGGSGNDQINGSNKSDVIFGNEGDDHLDGSNDNDQIYGGEGNDTINAGNGNDFIDAGSGNDDVSGSNGNDQIFGRQGNDKLDGSNGNDYIEGNEGDDQLRGRNGNDVLIGGPGNDSADGGSGTDTCEAETKTKCEL